MESLIFRPEPFGRVQQESGGCGCAACRQQEWEDPADEVDTGYELDSDDEVCPHCGLPREDSELDLDRELVDIVIAPPAARSYGKPSSKKNGKETSDRCKDGKLRPCPVLKDMVTFETLDGVGFDYIGGWSKGKTQFHGIERDPATKRYRVVEKNRLTPRKIDITARGAAGISAFIANLNAAGIPIEAILTMGSVNCRCIAGTDRLSDHSWGDAMDIGGVRFVGGKEVLVANAMLDPADRKLLHRANACARLSFARVIDYHDVKHHWNHFHCDTNQGGRRVYSTGWKYVREALGLPLAGGFNKALSAALRQFTGNQGAVKDADALDRSLTALFKREATRA